MLRNINMASAEEDAASRIMVFRPTLAEFSDFSSYITHMEEKGAHNYGIAKVSCTLVSLIEVALALDIVYRRVLLACTGGATERMVRSG